VSTVAYGVVQPARNAQVAADPPSTKIGMGGTANTTQDPRRMHHGSISHEETSSDERGGLGELNIAK
jgi:hypothetical protein